MIRYVLVAVILAVLPPISAAQPMSQWELAAGNLWSGVQLFYGAKKMRVGEIVCFTQIRQDKIVGIRMKNGTVEPKSRQSIVLGDWYVKRTDPALKKYEYIECK